MRCLFLILISLLVFTGCQTNEQRTSEAVVSQPETSPQAQEGPTPSSQEVGPSTNPKLQINEIATLEIALNKPPTFLPLATTDLNFQMQDLPEGFSTIFRPIGDAVFDAKGRLLLSFPTLNTLVRFGKASDPTQFFGPKVHGGKDEIIKRPGRISVNDSQILLTDLSSGKVVVYDESFQLKTMYQFPPPGPICGPGTDFLLFQDSSPNSFFRVNAQGQLIRSFSTPAQAGNQEGAERIFSVTNGWEVLAARKNMTQFSHLSQVGPHIRQFRLDASALFGKQAHQYGESGIRLHDIDFHQDAYWLLFGVQQQGIAGSYLLVLNTDGSQRHYWQMPYPADGMDFHQDRVVFLLRERGGAQIYRLPAQEH